MKYLVIVLKVAPLIFIERKLSWKGFLKNTSASQMPAATGLFALGCCNAYKEDGKLDKYTTSLWNSYTNSS